MIYPDNCLDRLGFNEVRQLIYKHCLSPMGQYMVGKMQVITKYDQINKFLRQTKEFKNILENQEPLQISSFFDIKTLANKAKLEGAFLTEDEFFQVLTSLSTVFAVIAYFNEREGQYSNLEALFEHLPIEKTIIKKTVTYDFARQMPGSKEVRCSEFGSQIIENM